MSDFLRSTLYCRKAAAEITRLEAELATMKRLFHESTGQVNTLTKELLEANAIVERQRAALKPFADYADPRGRMPPDLVITAGSSMAKYQLRMSHCYNARAALESEREKPYG